MQNLFEELEFRTLAKRLLNLESENTTNKATQAASSKTTTNSGQMDLFAMEEEIPTTSYQHQRSANKISTCLNSRTAL